MGQSLIDANYPTELILEALHHPAFANRGSSIQAIMFDTVSEWWHQRSDAEKKELSTVQLTQSGIQSNKNNPVVSAQHFHGYGHKGPAIFPGSQPTIKQPAPKSLNDDAIKLVEQAAQAIDKTVKNIEDGFIKLSDTIGEGMDAGGRALDDFATGVHEETNKKTDDIGDIMEESLRDVIGILNNARDKADKLQKEGDEAAGAQLLGDLKEKRKRTLGSWPC